MLNTRTAVGQLLHNIHNTREEERIRGKPETHLLSRIWIRKFLKEENNKDDKKILLKFLHFHRKKISKRERNFYSNLFLRSKLGV